jgi:hypothetical protein
MSCHHKKLQKSTKIWKIFTKVSGKNCGVFFVAIYSVLEELLASPQQSLGQEFLSSPNRVPSESKLGVAFCSVKSKHLSQRRVSLVMSNSCMLSFLNLVFFIVTISVRNNDSLFLLNECQWITKLIRKIWMKTEIRTHPMAIMEHDNHHMDSRLTSP